MFDATEPAALARQLFGPPGQELPSYSRRRKRAPRHFDDLVLSNLHSLWALNDLGYQAAILMILHRLTPLEGWSLVWEALEANESALQSIAVQTAYVHKGYEVSPTHVQTLVRLSQSGDAWVTRISAIESLERLGYEGLENLLHKFADDPMVTFRFNVNLMLLKRGTDTTASLFADLDSCDYVRWSEEDLWRSRGLLKMTSTQSALLQSRMRRQLIRIRRDCRRVRENPPAMSLFYFLKDGMPQTRGDVDRIGEAISRTTTARRQLNLVEAVAWFANDRAREWLRAVRDADSLPKTVRTAAKREIRKLDAATRRSASSE